MTIRARLLMLLLPILLAFILLISFFFYINWSCETVEGFQWRLPSIIIATAVPFIIIIITVFFIANRISQPVQQLNQAALDIASGNYETNIQVQGPKEIVELANTFNTMSECLVDHMHRLKETSITRKQLYGEQECAQLLQHYMLQKEVDEFSHPHWKSCVASTPLSSSSSGLLFRSTLIDKESFTITLFESHESGFSALFQLNRAYSLSPSQLNHYNHIHCTFTRDGTLHYTCQKMPVPLGWSIKMEQWKTHSPGTILLEPQDMLLLYNSALLNHFETNEAVRIWIGRVLRHFADDGLDNIQTILNNELNFLKRRENVKENMAILIFMRVS